MAKNQEIPSWVFYVVIVGVFIYGGTHGWFQGFTAGTASAPSEVNTEFYSYNVIITLTPNPVCVGSSVRGTINSNIQNGVCSLFSNPGTGWNLILNANLDQSGFYETSTTINVVGSANVRAVCCDNSGNCRISNVITLVSQMCGDSNPPAPICTDSDGGINWDVWGYCESSTTMTGVADDCSGPAQAIEWYCDDGECKYETLNCPAGTSCFNGRCISYCCQLGIDRYCSPTACPPGYATLTTYTSFDTCESSCSYFGLD